MAKNKKKLLLSSLEKKILSIHFFPSSGGQSYTRNLIFEKDKFQLKNLGGGNVTSTPIVTIRSELR